MAAEVNNSLTIYAASTKTGNQEYTLLRTGSIYDCFAIAGGAAAGTVTVSKAGAAISSVMDVSAAISTVARTTSVDDANNTMAIGDTLRVARTANVLSWAIMAFAAPGPSA